MQREIIKIDEEKCTGCGQCIPACPEGALQIIDGKARLISDLFCDGLGACMRDCPEDAIRIEKREAKPYSEARAMENIIKQGENTIKAHLKHLEEHGELKYLKQAQKYLKNKGISAPDYKKKQNMNQPCGCPGGATRPIQQNKKTSQPAQPLAVASRLKHWPVQMHLINPRAAYFDHADILLSADCVPFSYGDFHTQFVKDRVVITLCPKLDNSAEEYIEKLINILKNNAINSITVAKMEVPCCGGTELIAKEAIKRSGKIVPLSRYTITINGSINI